MAATLLAHALLTKAEAVAYLRIAAPSGDEDDLLTNIINAATEAIEAYLGRPIVPRTFTEYHDGDGGERLHLRRFPVTTLTAVERLETDGTVADTLDSSDYWLDDATGVLVAKPGRAWYAGTRNWRVTYDAGLVPTPQDIALAARRMVARAWRDYANERDDVETMSLEGQTVTYRDLQVPRELLRAWRVPAQEG